MSIKNYPEFRKLTYKDLQIFLDVPAKLAQKYLTDIKKEYNLRAVLFLHFKEYFKIPPEVVHITA